MAKIYSGLLNPTEQYQSLLAKRRLAGNFFPMSDVYSSLSPIYHAQAQANTQQALAKGQFKAQQLNNAAEIEARKEMQQNLLDSQKGIGVQDVLATGLLGNELYKSGLLKSAGSTIGSAANTLLGTGGTGATLTGTTGALPIATASSLFPAPALGGTATQLGVGGNVGGGVASTVTPSTTATTTGTTLSQLGTGLGVAAVANTAINALVPQQTSTGQYAADVLRFGPLGALTVGPLDVITGGFISKALGGGGGTVICTELYRQGYLSDAMLKLDAEFGSTVDNQTYRGYRKMADPIVKLMQKSKAFTWIVSRFALPWAEEMAHIVRPKIFNGNRFGRLIMKIGLPLCKWVGKEVEYAIT